MRVIDLFSGCGGLSYGFIKQGYELVKAYDNWEQAIKVYNTNFIHQAEQKDAYDIKVDELKKYDIDMIIGGPPCQDYSSAGKQDESLGRADLTLRFAELVCECRCKWFVMENVDRIIKSKTLPKAKALYKEAGYGLTEVVLDASKCGAPQKRKRYFLIGELGGEDDFLLNALIDNQSKVSMTIHDYLGDEFGTEYYYRHPRSYQRRGIFSIYEPSPTVRGVNRPIPPGYPIHKGDATKDLSKVRPLTTAERARIQTFPKNFVLIGSKTDLETMVGNAVPVELASYVAAQLKKYLESKGYEVNCKNEQIKKNDIPEQLSFF